MAAIIIQAVSIKALYIIVYMALAQTDPYTILYFPTQFGTYTTMNKFYSLDSLGQGEIKVGGVGGSLCTALVFHSAGNINLPKPSTDTFNGGRKLNASFFLVTAVSCSLCESLA